MGADAQRMAALPTQPTVTIVLLIQDPHLPWLADSVSSVVAQSYPQWELWLCDFNPSPSSRSVLEEYATGDTRIKIGPYVDSLEATDAFTHVLGLASGEYIALLEQHDMLPPWAVLEVILHLQHLQEAVDILYSDEDVIDAQGKRGAPFFKPDWSPDLCLSSPYACHFSVYKRSLIQRIGCFGAVDRHKPEL